MRSTATPRARFVGVVSRAVLRQWAKGCGLDTARPGRICLIGAGVALTVSVGLGAWVSGSVGDQLAPEASRPLVDLVVVTIALATALLVVMVQSTSAGTSRSCRVLQPLPVPTWLLILAMSAPVVLALMTLSLVVSPAIVMSVAGLTDLGAARVTAGTAGAFLIGATVGLTVVAVARHACRRWPTLSGMIYPVSVVILSAVTAANIWVVRATSHGTVPADLPVLSKLALAWPFAVDLMVAPEAGAVVALGAFVIAVGGTGLHLTSSGLLLVDDGSGRVRRTWRAGATLPLVRIEFLRLVRTRRIQAALAAGTVVAVSALAVVGMNDRARRADLAQSLLFPVGCSLVHICLLARGLSARHRPYQLVLGFSPARWAGAVAVSAGLLASVVWVPFVVGLTLLAGDPEIAMVAPGLQLFFFVAASIVGASVIPGAENVGGEILSLFALAVVATAVTQFTGQFLGDSTPVAASLVLGGASVCVLSLPGRIEAARWRTDVAAPAFTEPLASP